MDENDVNITRHKKILEGIRNGGQDDGRSGVGIGHAESSDDFPRPNEGSTDQGSRTGERSSQGTLAGSGTAQGLHSGARPPQPKDEHTTPRPRHRKPKEVERVEEKPTQARFRIPFLDHKPDQKKAVRLFSKEEAEASLEQLTEVYKKFFSACDEGLEICVKGHEEVEIWAATDAQAETFARRHLAHARFREEAARSARALMDASDDIEIIQFLVPRFMKTYFHIREHGGLSFK